MPQEWFVRRGDKVRGPLTSEEVKQLVAKGIVARSDMIRKSENSEWRNAGTIKGLFVPETSTPSVPPPLPQVKVDTPVASVTPPPTQTSANRKASSSPPPAAKAVDTMQAGLADIMSTAKQAKDLAAAHARRTQLIQMTLPKAYLALGRDVFANERFREEFSDRFQRITTTNNETAKVASTTKERPQATDLKGKLQSGAAQIMAQGQTTKLGFQRDSLVRSLGKMAFESHGNSAGSPELLSPIIAANEEIAVLDDKIGKLSSGDKGPLWQRLPLAALLTVFCWPVGMLFVWLNPHLTRRSKWGWTGASALALLVLALIVPKSNRPSAVVQSETHVADVGNTPANSPTKEFSGSGPNGEKVMKGDHGDGTGRYWHYYIDKDGKEVMHGPSLYSSCCPKRSEHDVYKQGILQTRSAYDTKGDLVESLMRLDDGSFQRNEYTHANDAITQYQSIITFTTVKGVTEIKTIKRKEQTVQPKVQVTQGGANTPPPTVRGRSLTVRIGTVNGNRINNSFNQTLKEVRCYAQDDDKVTIVFNVDVAAWRKLQSNWTLPLQIRMFDKNGSYLTHFDTVEVFTPLSDTYEQFKPHYEQSKAMVERGISSDRIDRMHRPVLLNSNWNTHTYPVNVRDVRDAAIVEIGFLDHAHPGDGG